MSLIERVHCLVSLYPTSLVKQLPGILKPVQQFVQALGQIYYHCTSTLANSELSPKIFIIPGHCHLHSKSLRGT